MCTKLFLHITILYKINAPPLHLYKINSPSKDPLMSAPFIVSGRQFWEIWYGIYYIIIYLCETNRCLYPKVEYLGRTTVHIIDPYIFARRECLCPSSLHIINET